MRWGTMMSRDAAATDLTIRAPDESGEEPVHTWPPERDTILLGEMASDRSASDDRRRDPKALEGVPTKIHRPEQDGEPPTTVHDLRGLDDLAPLADAPADLGEEEDEPPTKMFDVRGLDDGPLVPVPDTDPGGGAPAEPDTAQHAAPVDYGGAAPDGEYYAGAAPAAGEYFAGDGGPPPEEEDRGWGPQNVPEEAKRTNFWARDGRLVDEPADPAEDAVTVFVTLPEDRAKGEPVPEDSGEIARPSRPAGVVRSTARHPRMSTSTAKKTMIVVAALTGVAGIIIGVSVGFSMGDTEETAALPEAQSDTTETATEPETVEAAEPEPAEPEAADVEDTEAAEGQDEAEAAENGEDEAEAAEGEDEAEPETPAVPPAELVTDAMTAVEDFDVERAQEALVSARGAGAAELETARVEARLAVVRGDGALAVPRLQVLAEQHADATIWTAYGRVLVQAENDRGARGAFERAVELDGGDVDAHLGLAHIEARAADVSSAQRHLRRAQDAARRAATPSTRLSARLRVAEGVIAFERGRLGDAASEAAQAISVDHHSSEAAVLLARIALARRDDPLPHLQTAVNGRAVAPFALAMLAARTDREEACELANRYLERAPEGFDADAMRRLASRCTP